MTMPRSRGRASRRSGPLRRLRVPALRRRVLPQSLRAPVVPRLTRPRAHAAVALVGMLAMTMGAGSAALAGSGSVPPVVVLTTLGPVSVHLPDDVGPWSVVPTGALDPLHMSDALGGAEVDGMWGAVAPGAVVVTVLTAVPSRPGAAVGAVAVPGAGAVTWSGRHPHVAGAHDVNGMRELMLAVAGSDDLLVILSLCGPVAAFESGTLAEAFRTATVDVGRVRSSR